MKKPIVLISIIFLFLFVSLYSEELPRPTYDNSLMFSMTYSLDAGTKSEIDSIKTLFGDGIYAPLCFSHFEGVSMDWHVNPVNANTSIAAFKQNIDTLVNKAREYEVGLHLILVYGMSRDAERYTTAKTEDIRNAQWYNDNNLATESQLQRVSNSSYNTRYEPGTLQNVDEEMGTHRFDAMKDRSFTTEGADAKDLSLTSAGVNINKFVYSTFSRYARKLRSHLHAKVEAALKYIKLKQDANPHMNIIVSAPGEAELNSLRINPGQIQEFFCDYSPFAVLEFRDWITHQGLYGPGQIYDGEGYDNGGSRYQGADGLNHFNSDFGTSFSTWDLKYYHWSLNDSVDSDYSDSSDPDPNAIPASAYTFDGMMPQSGVDYIAGGFDPPRVMKEDGVSAFYDLWHLFRQTLVYHYVKDMAEIARNSGVNKSRYYTHQIPGDYLFGTRPNDPNFKHLNNRYYASASPLWSADAYPDLGVGVTMYDINFATFYARTSEYILPVLNAMSSNWGALEYNPEILAEGVPINTTENILTQMYRVYDNNAHVISFFKWIGDDDTQFKGTNRAKAAKLFFDDVKDRARQTTGIVFDPKSLESLVGYYTPLDATINLTWSEKIWKDLSFRWYHWGDFKEYVIYRGTTSTFPPESQFEVTRTSSNFYIDSSFPAASTVYYKVAVVNKSGFVGPVSTIAVAVNSSGGAPIMTISKEKLVFGAVEGGVATDTQVFRVQNSGLGIMNWNASSDKSWLHCNPVSGTNNGSVKVSVDATGKTAGTYTGTITIESPGANGSPKTVEVTLKVYRSGQDAKPFGTFETPIHNSTVRSSIPVTGWVLDDVGIDSVTLYRHSNSGLIRIGEAILVEGARPDVEAAYPDYPANYKAGWGYMLLTNFLPNKGNGTFTLQANAKDVNGNVVNLGTRTIICDNKNAVKPFGAIDTPAQGGTAFGNYFINYGWVLTPQPNAIAEDGSTIGVYVDGLKIGMPVYNNYRKDIATLFPDYANSNGAVGYFYLDTTAYEDGVHTIAWSAMDNGGNSDGIGSRYFIIDNGTSDSEQSQQKTGLMIKSKHQTVNLPASVLFQTKLPVDSSPIAVKKGFVEKEKMDYLSPVDGGEAGVFTVSINPMERVEIHLSTQKNTRVLNRTPLPVGSTLDQAGGIFYWQPGLAYKGTFSFTFILFHQGAQPVMKTLIIEIR